MVLLSMNYALVSTICQGNAKDKWQTVNPEEVLELMSWFSGTVITDSDTEHMDVNLSLSRYFDLRPHARIRISSRTSADYLSEQLLKVQTLAGTSHHNYLLLCGDRCVKRVISVVNSLDMRTSHRTYIRNQSKWLVVTSSGVRDDLKELGDQLDNLALLEVDLHPRQPGADIRGLVYTLMWYPSGRVWVRVPLPHGRHGLSFSEKDVFPNTINGYNGRTLLVTLMEWRQFVIGDVTNGSISYRGMCVDILDTIARRLNFTYVLSEPPDRRWGVYEHGVWDGIVRQLIDREVNLTIAPLAMSSQRQKVIDFLSTPVSFEFTDIAFEKRESLLQDWWLMMRIFRPTAMLCVGAALVVVWGLLTVIEYRLERRTGGLLMITADTFLIVYGSLFKVGSVHLDGWFTPLSSRRMVVASWGLFSIMMASIYSSSLVANMAAPVDHAPFTSLDDMLASPNYKWGIVGGEAHQQVIAESKHRTLSKLWHKILESNKTDPTTTSSNSSAHLIKLTKELYALVYTRYSHETSINCHIAYLGEKIAIFTAGMAIPKDSPLKDDLNTIMLKLAANGVLIKLERKWLSSSNAACEQDSVKGHRPATVPILMGAFYCLAIGCLGGGIVLGLEFLYARHRQ